MQKRAGISKRERSSGGKMEVPQSATDADALRRKPLKPPFRALDRRNYADGSLVRTIGGQGRGNGQFYNPRGVVIDGDGRIIVCNASNSRIEVLQ
jgi:hypothetical protein